MRRVVISALFILAAVAFVFGQQSNNDADKTLRGSGRVNPSTLAMEFDLPLGNYPGRGINVPISLSYSSKLWRMDYTGDTPGGVITGGCRSLNHPEYAENSASGWTTSLAVPYVEYTGKDQLFTHHGFSLEGYDQSLCDPESPPPPYYQNAWIRRINVHLPSGETHELRVDDEPVVYSPSSMCPPQYGYSCDPNSYWLQENWNRTFYAVDGSNLKYVEDSTTSTYRLLMPDGSFYDFSNSIVGFNNSTARKATKFTDRNGNFTTYNDATGAWTDTLGRTLSPPIGPSAPTQPTTAGNPIVYTMPGMTGSHKFHWKRLKGASPAESALTDFNQDLKYRGDKITMTGNGNWSVRPAGTYLFSSEWDAYVTSYDGLFNPVVLTEIELPTGQKYKFSYDLYGRIEKIIYPTGGEEKFQYGVVAALSVPPPNGDVSSQTNHGVVNRKVYETTSDPTPYEWTYSAGHVAPAGYVATVNNPDGTRTERLLHRGLDPCTGCPEGNFGFDNGLAGMAYEERSFNSAGTLVSQKLMQWAKKSFGRADWHPRVTQEESIIYDSSGNGVSATTTYAYEGDLNLRETPVLVNKTTWYAFETRGGGGSYSMLSAPCSPADPECEPPPTPYPTPTPLPTPSLTPIKIVESTYLINDPNYAGVKGYYTAQNMVGLATASQVKDGAGKIVSRSETVYDESGRSPGYRGNLTTLKVWDSTKGAVTISSAYISTRAKFDSYGNRYEATDAKGNTTTTTFDSTYSAFPIQVTSPIPDPANTHGSNSAFVTTATFDATTGLPLTTTDANGLETRITYDPVTLRPLNTKTYYNNVQVGATAETVYHDEPNNYWVKNRSQIDTNLWSETITYFDGLGRAWKTEELNSNGNIFVEKEFDADGRVLRVSNPFRSGETKVWTTNVYDEASRVKEVVLQDGAKILTDYGVSVTGVVGVTKQITDQAGKKRKGISDALGRMTRVIEDPSGQALSTDYIFDTLGNLRKTVQGGQNRFFIYDSLGRLLYAKQPEQDTRSAFVATDPITNNTAWSVKYEYDDNGNITRTTDAKGEYIDGSYDNLNRLKVRNYSNLETPDASFFYDGKGLGTEPARSKGKTTKVASSVSETRYTFFDELGRLKNHQQITDGQTYSTEYGYNLSGGLVSETYPSGRTVSYEINADGDLSRVWGQRGSAATTYANAFNYNVNGAVEKLRLGNGKWETAAYNNRLQITQIGLGTGSNDTSLLKLAYSYNTTGQTNNNGNLREQKITVPGAGGTSGFTATQTYTYDDLNRLQVAEEKVAGNTTWKQTFVIDRFGNREFDAANTTTLGSCTQAVCNPGINIANNRFASGQGYAYDQNGSVTQDAEGKRFAYDAENHQTKFFAAGNGSNDPDATYSYDGDGRRIKKVTAAETTVFVYNASGQLVAEYSTQISQTPQVSYLTTDHLGSPRVVTDQLGAVKDRKDYSAFGEETISAQRQKSLGYTAIGDELRKGYTGYEKDSESGLDFAQARYYNSTHGRYTRIAPLTASASIRNPQTFNRYSYVLNSPYKYTDPLGLRPESFSNFKSRVLDAINGKGKLSEADLELAKFHIRNGTALGYSFLNASHAEIRRQNQNSRPQYEVTNVEVFKGPYPKRGLPDDEKSVTNPENGTTSATPYGVQLSVQYVITEDSAPLDSINLYEDNKVEVQAIVSENGKLTVEKSTLEYSALAGTTDKNGKFTDAPLGYSTDTPLVSFKITQTLYTKDKEGKRQDLVTNTITAASTLAVKNNRVTGSGVLKVSFSNAQTTKNLTIQVPRSLRK